MDDHKPHFRISAQGSGREGSDSVGVGKERDVVFMYVCMTTSTPIKL